MRGARALHANVTDRPAHSGTGMTPKNIPQVTAGLSSRREGRNTTAVMHTKIAILSADAA